MDSKLSNGAGIVTSITYNCVVITVRKKKSIAGVIESHFVEFKYHEYKFFFNRISFKMMQVDVFSTFIFLQL